MVPVEEKLLSVLGMICFKCRSVSIRADPVDHAVIRMILVKGDLAWQVLVLVKEDNLATADTFHYINTKAVVLHVNLDRHASDLMNVYFGAKCILAMMKKQTRGALARVLGATQCGQLLRNKFELVGQLGRCSGRHCRRLR